MITADQLKDVLERAEALNHYLNIDQKKVEFEEEQLRTQAPDFWDDPKRAEEQMCDEDKLRCWRHREPGLGTDAHAYVYALGRGTWA